MPRAAPATCFRRATVKTSAPRSINICSKPSRSRIRNMAGRYIFGGSVQSSIGAGHDGRIARFVGRLQRQRAVAVADALQRSELRALADAPASLQLRRHQRFAVGFPDADHTARHVDGRHRSPMRARNRSIMRGTSSTAPGSPRADDAGEPRPRHSAITPTPDSTGSYTISINNTDASGVSHVESYSLHERRRYSTTEYRDEHRRSDQREHRHDGPVGLIQRADAAADADQRRRRRVQRDRRAVAGAARGHEGIELYECVSACRVGDASADGFDAAGRYPQRSQRYAQCPVAGGFANERARANQHANSTDVVNNTSVQSGIEDTDIAKATTQFTLTQTALTAAYSTTSRLEAKDLFDYL